MFLNRKFVTVYSNSVDAFIPEIWANQVIATLRENMVVAKLVHRDFENDIKNFGDVVNIPKPASLEAYRKATGDNVVTQDATSENVQVPLNQWVHSSFLIYDSEQSKSWDNLRDRFAIQAALGMARYTDTMLLGQWPRFLNNNAGVLGGFTESTAKGYILDLRQKFNENKAPEIGRNLILTPVSETTMLKQELFISAEKVGDKGSALENAALGRKLGWDMYMCQNTPYVGGVNASDVSATMLVNNSAGYPVGTTTLTVDGISGAVHNNMWVSIGGIPYYITDHTETSSNTTEIVLDRGLQIAVANNDVITRYVAGQVNLSGGYAANYSKEIIYDTWTGNPQVGQAVIFGVTSGGGQPIYSIMKVDTTNKTIRLDRPLEAAIANDAKICTSPPGAFNFAFDRNALALVIRPLSLPDRRTGVQGAVASFDGISVRVVITYDGNAQAHRVTLDMLCGVAVLQEELGGVLLG